MKRPTNLSVMSSEAGLPPGTLIHVGNKLTNDVKITVMNYSETVFEQVEVSTAQEAHDLNRPDCVSWINVDGLHDIKLIEELGELFGLHHLLLEDVLNTTQRPKEEDFDDISFLDQDKLKKQEQKIESGEITCNLDNPEDCESCSG